jgi:hypothetical protein
VNNVEWSMFISNLYLLHLKDGEDYCDLSITFLISIIYQVLSGVIGVKGI